MDGCRVRSRSLQEPGLRRRHEHNEIRMRQVRATDLTKRRARGVQTVPSVQSSLRSVWATQISEKPSMVMPAIGVLNRISLTSKPDSPVGSKRNKR